MQTHAIYAIYSNGKHKTVCGLKNAKDRLTNFAYAYKKTVSCKRCINILNKKWSHNHAKTR
jgi:hypothetical protein